VKNFVSEKGHKFKNTSWLAWAVNCTKMSVTLVQLSGLFMRVHAPWAGEDENVWARVEVGEYSWHWRYLGISRKLSGLMVSRPVVKKCSLCDGGNEHNGSIASNDLTHQIPPTLFNQKYISGKTALVNDSTKNRVTHSTNLIHRSLCFFCLSF
jgi:hypothetical protein